MPKVVILGSCKYEPYEILFVPKKVSEELYNTEEGYKIASKKCYTAIDEADEVWVYIPEGMGEHTTRDFEYALSKNKKIFLVVDFERFKIWQNIVLKLKELLTRMWIEIIKELEKIGRYEFGL